MSEIIAESDTVSLQREINSAHARWLLK